MQPLRRIAIIGGGISGLAAAHRLRELAPNTKLTLFEATERVGGILQTTRQAGFLIERSADGFITNPPWALDLCHRLGISDQLLEINQDRRAFVVCRGRLCEVPPGFTLMAPARLWPVLRSPILSPLGKLRLALEYFVPARRRAAAEDESLAAFARRRLGREVFERLVQPLIGGIYTADPERLSLAATMPRFLEMERLAGGLLRASRRQAREQGGKTGDASGARFGLFMSLRNGMTSLVDALAGKLGSSIRLLSPVQSLEVTADKTWQIKTAAHEAERFDGVVLAAPVKAASELLRNVSPELAAEVVQIGRASSAIVCVGYRREQFSKPLQGFGFVAPRIESRSLLSVSYASLKYPGRAPNGHVLLRAFFGGALQPELALKSDGELLELTRRELGELLGLQGEPVITEIARWREAMPQYLLGHLQRVQKISALAAELPHFALAGNAFHGVGIPHCVRDGELAAENILAV